MPEKIVVLKYHGKGAGLTAHNIPGKDLTEDDLQRLEHIHISREAVMATGLYKKVRTKRTDKRDKE